VQKTFRVGLISHVERGLSDGADLLDAPEEDVGGSEERETRVVMLIVVPPEEWGQPASRVHFAQEAPRIVELVLQGLELGFAEGVVVRDMRAAERGCRRSRHAGVSAKPFHLALASRQ
jgi:hypothetical protein